MRQLFDERVASLADYSLGNLFAENKIGLEKESLRVGPDGVIAQTDHPTALGASLTHPSITTDYSEALLEFVTPPFSGHEQLMSYLRDCQAFVYSKMDNELLWATSMPCVLAGESSIPLAKYGDSNLGNMKTTYRRGLGLRYGRVMQVIAGVHFNFSFSKSFWDFFQELEKDKGDHQTFITKSYFQMIRNFQRFGWLIPYLFGASPAVCKSFLAGQETNMEVFDETTLYYPYATSLRMGDIGYQNSKEDKSGIRVNYDTLENYIKSLSHAVSTKYEPYEKMGVKTNGKYKQLNANLLQIENEYYSSVRPKQLGAVYEMPVNMLKDRGVAYVELRSLDVNVYEPMGISEDTLYFLEAFSLFCLLETDEVISEEECREITQNMQDVAHHGRNPTIQLRRNGKAVGLKQWASEIFDQMESVCEILDKNMTGTPYLSALNRYRQRIEDPDATPSAKMIREMRDNKEGFYQFSLRKSQEHDAFFRSMKIDESRIAYFQQLSEKSIEEQLKIEQADVLNFDNFLDHYFNQTLGAQQPYVND